MLPQLLRYNTSVQGFFFSAEVAAARSRGAAIVALESTIIAHGFEYPANLELARDLEREVRQHGAVPATIAVVAGVVHIGIDAAILENLARNGGSFRKAGATDLAVHVARGNNAATTVSATAVIAAAAGISVFATGGIGGVHRGSDGDISHDLVAVARTPLAVISAGAKAILDLPKTVEALETLGVLVVGFGCNEFPAFYTAQSGVKLEHRCDDVLELAAILQTHWQQFAGGGALIANPIPLTAALAPAPIAQAVADALREAIAAGIGGKKLTPFLLRRLAEITQGQSVIANRALALNNAKLGALLAVALRQYRA